MMRSDTASAEQLEAWVLSGYQRLERLAVPVFAADKKHLRLQQSAVAPVSMRLLPAAGMPRELCDLGSWLTGSKAGMPELDAGLKLSILFRYLAGPLRYEPYSETAIHKAVPSSRGRYPLKHFLVQSIAGQSRVYAYIPEFHGLQELSQLESSDLKAGESALVCIGRAWRYAEEYGEFAHVPCVLEAGHAYSQTHHLAQLLEIGGLAHPDRELGRALCAEQFEVPLYCIGLRSDFVVQRCPLKVANVSVPGPYPEMGSRFPKLGLFQRCFDGGVSPKLSWPSSAPSTAACRPDVVARGLLDLLRRRTSANDRGGIASVLSEVPEGTFLSVVATWNAVRKRRPANAAEQGLRFSLAWLAQEADNEPNIYDIEGQNTTVSSWRGDLHEALSKMLPYANSKYNFSSLTAVLIIQADILTAIEHLEESALREIYIAAGAAAQDFSIAATAHDMFARPVKMMREARLESEVSLRGQVVYLVLCGFARSANPTMEFY